MYSWFSADRECRQGEWPKASPRHLRLVYSGTPRPKRRPASPLPFPGPVGGRFAGARAATRCAPTPAARPAPSSDRLHARVRHTCWRVSFCLRNLCSRLLRALAPAAARRDRNRPATGLDHGKAAARAHLRLVKPA